MAEQTAAKKHTVSALARERAEINGVSEVISFDEQSVILVTDCGELTLEGQGLHVGTLDIQRGLVEVTGQIDALIYSDKAAAKRGLRARIFG